MVPQYLLCSHVGPVQTAHKILPNLLSKVPGTTFSTASRVVTWFCCLLSALAQVLPTVYMCITAGAVHCICLDYLCIVDDSCMSERQEA